MPHEIRLVESNVFDRADALVTLKFNHPIHQQERVAVGELLENCVNIHYEFPLLLFGAFKRALQLFDALSQHMQLL